MIEVYKIVTNKYESIVSGVLEFHTNTITRGDKYKLLTVIRVSITMFANNPSLQE